MCKLYRIINVVLLFTIVNCIGQLNLEQVGVLDLCAKHSTGGNDIWGWADTLGNEYAIVGLEDGTSIVDVTNAANPKEVFFEPGMNSPWRDIKTWGSVAYVTTEAKNGLLMIDLSSLPGDTNLTVKYYSGNDTIKVSSAHNLFIDEKGVLYLFGALHGNGTTANVVMLDVKTDPMNPTVIGVVKCPYVHDGYARGDTLYVAHVRDGYFTIWDIKDKAKPVKLVQHATTTAMTHQIWISDDAKRLFIAQEISNGYIEEYDISDFSDVQLLSKVQSSPGNKVVPHNTFFINDYLVTSQYTDGVTVHDVSKPGVMVEVGNFDTHPEASDQNMDGCWGVYPWLPSGHIIASDGKKGLFVLKPKYVRACYLEGTVTELGSGAPIGNIFVEIVGEAANASSSLIGEYIIGHPSSGTFDVKFSGPYHQEKIVQGVKLENGKITVVDVELTPKAFLTSTIKVQDVSGNPIAGAKMYFDSGDGIVYDMVTNSSGSTASFIQTNPISSVGTVEYSGMPIGEEFIILDYTGKIVYQITIENAEGTLYIGQGLSSGMYLAGFKGFNQLEKVVKL